MKFDVCGRDEMPLGTAGGTVGMLKMKNGRFLEVREVKTSS